MAMFILSEQVYNCNAQLEKGSKRGEGRERETEERDRKRKEKVSLPPHARRPCSG